MVTEDLEMAEKVKSTGEQVQASGNVPSHSPPLFGQYGVLEDSPAAAVTEQRGVSFVDVEAVLGRKDDGSGVGLGVAGATSFAPVSRSTAAVSFSPVNDLLPSPFTPVGVSPVAASSVLQHDDSDIGTFSGEGTQVSAAAFMRMFDLLCSVRGWNDDNKRLQFVRRMRNKAMVWATNLAEQDFGDWSRMRSSFMARFDRPRLGASPAMRIKSLKMKQGQSVEQYAADFFELARDAKIDASGVLGKDLFVSGLHEDIQMMVRGQLHLDLSALVSYASVLEAAKRPQQRSQQQQQPRSTQASSQPETSEKAPFLCFNCGEEGHSAKRCPHPRRARQQADQPAGPATPAPAAQPKKQGFR